MLSSEAGDVVELYDTEEVFDPTRNRPGKALAHKPNGDCVYLGTRGCTIHSWRPSLCRAFDCRLYYFRNWPSRDASGAASRKTGSRPRSCSKSAARSTRHIR